jgi:hypothetical protein
MPARLLLRDQDRQLERLGEADPAELARQALSNDEVPGLQRSGEDGPRTALRGRRSSSLGAETAKRV